MRKEDLSFFDRAPVRHVFEASIRATRSEVFAAIADPTTWPDWFPGVRAARYRGAPPHGIGTIREADVSGTHWVEEMLAWEPDRLWAYTVVASSTPLAKAQVESFELEDVPGVSRGPNSTAPGVYRNPTATDEFVAETVAGMNYLKAICRDLDIPVE